MNHAPCLLLFLALGGQALHGQMTLAPGARVRLTLQPTRHRMTGRFEGFANDSIRLVRSRDMHETIAVSELARIEYSVGRGNGGKTGALVGLLAFAGFALYSELAIQSGSDVDRGTLTVLAGATAGVTIGAGYLIGSAIRWEAWREVPFPNASPGFEPRPGSFLVGVRMRL